MDTYFETPKAAGLQLSTTDRRMDCIGEWTINHLRSIQTLCQQSVSVKEQHWTIDGARITKMDSSGAWQLQNFITRLVDSGAKISLQSFSAEHQNLLQWVKTQIQNLNPLPEIHTPGWINQLGRHAVQALKQLHNFLNFAGETAYVNTHAAKKPRALPWQAFFNVIDVTGFQALPIIALLSFMIGVVLTYQMGLQLRNYGANIFIVDLLGLAVLREFGSLLTAIIVAGRSGSAFTAQLGTMQLNEEIDALRSMGISPLEILIAPKILGLVLVLPLLTMWANIFGILGGMVMAKVMLNISWQDFLQRFQSAISLSSLLIGIGKAPVFALLISSIGCFQGLQTRGGADNVGKQTTKSVVQAIFAVIVADALFSIVFSKLGI